MIPAIFPECNIELRAPDDLEDLVRTIHAMHVPIESGRLEGGCITVVAWKPTAEELQQLQNGAPVFITFMGGVPPHFPSTNINAAVKL